MVSPGDVTNFHMHIGGWLTQATTTYYDADGRVTATFDYARDTSDPDYWNNIYTAIDTGTLSADMEEPPSGSPPALNDAANGAGYGVLDLQSQVAHGAPVTGAGGYDAEGHALVYTYRAITSQNTWHTTTYDDKPIRGRRELSDKGTDPEIRGRRE